MNTMTRWSHHSIGSGNGTILRTLLVCVLAAALVMLSAATATAEQPTEPAPAAAEAQDGSEESESAQPAGWERLATYRSPGLAATLSLTPVPVDFGNLYAENVGWGLGYTAVQISLITPLVWLTAQRMGWGHHGESNGNGSGLNATERAWALGLFTGFVVTKLISAAHAAVAAEEFNEAHRPDPSALGVVPLDGGAGLTWRMYF